MASLGYIARPYLKQSLEGPGLSGTGSWGNAERLSTSLYTGTSVAIPGWGLGLGSHSCSGHLQVG